ncbi:ureidoglycolate lyase [Pseudomonas sp. RL_15y_Pfl2_60]|uniref:ureidoglycolate lyase n=1 Tax=Pseudomonas sp. RL_15y_Pfl2_60 TaxID=3088709 RepID=UPI0030DA7881
MSKPLVLGAEPLTRESFAPFGDVLESDGAEHFLINAGSTTRYHDLAQVQACGPMPRVLFNLFDGLAAHSPLQINRLERHPLGSQAFYPVDDARMLIVVAPAGDLDEGSIRAFISRGDQGVNYAPGTWHHPLLSVGRAGRFVVIDRGGEGHNCDEQDLQHPLLVSL